MAFLRYKILELPARKHEWPFKFRRPGSIHWEHARYRPSGPAQKQTSERPIRHTSRPLYRTALRKVWTAILLLLPIALRLSQTNDPAANRAADCPARPSCAI